MRTPPRFLSAMYHEFCLKPLLENPWDFPIFGSPGFLFSRGNQKRGLGKLVTQTFENHQPRSYTVSHHSLLWLPTKISTHDFDGTGTGDLYKSRPSFLLKIKPPFQRLQNRNCRNSNPWSHNAGISGTFVMAISSNNSFSPYKRFLQKTKLQGCWPLVNFGDYIGLQPKGVCC